MVTATEGLTYRVVSGSFAGYRVDEDYLGVGVHTAVGRTSAVTGTLRVVGTRVVAADLRADMTQLRSDQAQRDDTLRGRAIETDRFPRAAFPPAEGFGLGAARGAHGRLTLHGVTAPITLNVSSALRPGRLELIGRAPIAFKDFGLDPPSVAGLVKVQAK